MIDITTLIDNFVDVKDNTLNISVTLSIPEFSKVFNQTDKKRGKQELTYVALLGSYKSEINIKGLTGSEAHIAVCKKVGLPTDYKPTADVKAAIKYYNKHYSFGVIGILKELNRSFELTRVSINMINSILYNYQRAIKTKLAGELTDEEVTTLNNQIKSIIDNTSQIRNISGNLETDISNLKKIEAKVVTIETKSITPLGGGNVPKSAMRTKN